MYYTSLTKAIAAKGHIDLSKCPNIHCSGSVRGMKRCGFWPKDQLAAYPIAKGSVYKGNYSYPRRGEKFRLGMKFTSTAQAQKAMNALEDGTKTLKDFVNTFDTTPNLTRKQICECL